MSETPKLLVTCPTYDGKTYALEKYMSVITNLTYPNYDILIVDNSAHRKGPFFKRLDKYPKGNAGEKTIISDRRSSNTRRTICKSRNKSRDFFLKGSYDYMLSVEFDLIPPLNIAEQLLRNNVPIITAMYEIGYRDKATKDFGINGKYPLLHVAHKKLQKTLPNVEGKYPTPTPFPCPHCEKNFYVVNGTKQMPQEEMLSFIDGSAKKVHGCGLGCTLITKKVLEACAFRINTQYNFHDDTFFYQDLWNAGVPVYVHTGFFIPHFNQDWRFVKNA